MRICLLLLSALAPHFLFGQSLELHRPGIHLRSGNAREWSTFPEAGAGMGASVKFEAEANSGEWTLMLRQRDVKNANWRVTLNGRQIGILQEDERDMLRMLPIPAGTVVTGPNQLQITCDSGRFSDDIEVSAIRIERIPLRELMSQATAKISVATDDENMPVKLTVVDSNGSLVPFASLRPDAHEARRTGVLYSSDGTAEISLPRGSYRVYASRGFEYNAPSARLQLGRGSRRSIRLRVRREVRLPSYVSCDTHVHTLELSKHGDASVDERVLTGAGEGLDIIVATEHNRVDDYGPAVARRTLDRWLLSVPGNEVTTATGHFNIFPVIPGTPQPDPMEKDWSTQMQRLRQTEGVQVIVQNHPRDLHSNYRPFDPTHHLSSVGTNFTARPFSANAVEVVNSGAMASGPMQLVRDWMGLLTRGIPVAAIGASDTHTVDFVPIGQARTYIQAPALGADWRGDITGLFRSLADGKNLVSYGLAAELRIASPPRTAPGGIAVPVDLTIHGPSWSTADHVAVYSNGQLVWEQSVAADHSPGVKLKKSVTLTLPAHDTALVAVATGPGVLQPFWEVRKPYQPTSPDWTPRVMGISSAVWIDGDADSKRSAPLAYAQRLTEEAGGDLARLVRGLTGFDTSVALHVLDILRLNGMNVPGPDIQAAFTADKRSANAYALYLSEFRQIRTGP